MKPVIVRSFLEACKIAEGPPILLGLKVDASRMMRAFKTPDDVGAIIRLHKDLDHELKHTVSVMVPKSARPKLRSIVQHIECLKSAGLPEERLAASKKINQIRNAFAHGDKECFDEADVDELLKAIRLVLGEHFTPTALHDLTVDPYGEWDYRNIDCKGRFCQLAIVAVALVASIKSEFEKHSFRPRLPMLLCGIPQIQQATREHTLLLFL